MVNNAFEQIKECIRDNQSFILEAGAGSGKTYTLIQTIQFLLEKKGVDFISNGQKIACITYTNAAKDELKHRLEDNDLIEVNTIHDFLWSLISVYQQNLKKELLAYHNTFDAEKKIDNLDDILTKTTISYGKYGRRLEKGEITHEDVIYLSVKLLKNYPKLGRILCWKYPFFFIDEYQDTFTEIVNILLEILSGNKSHFLIGFFGDFMQKIYHDDRIGKIENHNLKTIQKIENFRSGKKIVALINKVRGMRDNLVQVAQQQFDGEINFYYTNKDFDETKKYEIVKEKLGWDFSGNPKENKILVLTNKKIANDLGFNGLLSIFEARFGRYGYDRLKERDEAYINLLLDKVEEIIMYYKNKNYSGFFELFGKEDFSIKYMEDRKVLNDLMVGLENIRNKETIGNVLNYIFENHILVKTDKIISFEEYLLKDVEEEQKEKLEMLIKFRDDLMNLHYHEIINLKKHLEEETPYSTQHGTKGTEYKNVLLVIDDSHKWYIYRGFDKLVSGTIEKQDAQERLLNLLYVSVSRAKENLVILYLSNLDQNALNGWNSIFGAENIFEIT